MSIFFSAIFVVLRIVEFAIVASVLLTWIPQARDSKFAAVLSLLTEPILSPLRELLNKAMNGRSMMFDFSPLLALILIGILRNLLLRLTVF